MGKGRKEEKRRQMSATSRRKEKGYETLRAIWETNKKGKRKKKKKPKSSNLGAYASSSAVTNITALLTLPAFSTSAMKT